MRQRLFTKEIDNKLFAQYKYGSDLSKQMVVAKIFNPFNRGQWYIINSDPNDPDYLWAIVDLFEIEAGSVSREDLQTIKVPPFGLNLERDLYFQPINAQELYDRLRQGERFEHGGSIDVIQNDKGESYLTSVNAKPTDAAIKLAHGGMSENIEVGDLVRVKKYGFIMRVDKIEGNMYFLENDRRGSMNGNNGSYLISDIEKYEKYADGGETDDYTKSLALVTVKFSNPEYNYSTNLSGSVSEADARKYFVGKSFNVGKYPKENMQKCIDIDFKAKGTYADGGETMSTAKEIGLLSGLRPIAVAEWGDRNNVNLSIILKDLKAKKLKGIDLLTAVVSNKNNKYSKDILSKYSRTSMAEGGEIAKSWTVMYFKEGKNRFGEKIESSFNNTRVQGTLKDAISQVKEELVGNITYATIKDRSIGDVLVAKVKQDGTINIYREGYGFDKMADGGEINGYKYKTNFYGINIYTNVDQTYINDLYSPFESKGSFKANVRRIDFEAIAIESDALKKYNFVYGKDDGKTIAQKLKQDGVNDLELIKVGKIITTFEFVPINKMAKGGVTFKDKVKSISNSLKGKKVPSKLKKDYGATYDKKESVLAATRIAGAMKAKMESKKKR